MTSPYSRIAVVTGAAQGIGAAVAKRLATAGSPVAALDIDGAALDATVASIEDAGGHVLGVQVDVSRGDEVAAAIEQVRASLGPPTILVNNAGAARDTCAR